MAVGPLHQTTEIIWMYSIQRGIFIFPVLLFHCGSSHNSGCELLSSCTFYKNKIFKKGNGLYSQFHVQNLPRTGVVGVGGSQEGECVF